MVNWLCAVPLELSTQEGTRHRSVGCFVATGDGIILLGEESQYSTALEY